MWGRRSGHGTIRTTRFGRSSGSLTSASTRRAIRIIGASTICSATATMSNHSDFRSTWCNCRCRRDRSRSRRARTSCWRRNRSGSARSPACSLIERLAAAGIPAAKYNLTIIGIPRTEREPGRGGSRNAAFRWSRADQNVPPGRADIVSEDEYWERIDHFLAAIVPVATAAKVRLACHPQDPYTPPGYRGVTSVLGAVDGLKRLVTMHESPYHGLNFCQGTVCEMLDDPAREIFDVIRWFGERGKLFNVHFRNIKGRRLDFMEAFPDEGDIDMARAITCYREVGYQYMLMPDHVPQIDGRDPSGVAFAYCYGYIQALLDALTPRPVNAS